jgi:hypothetical protein
LPKLELNTEYLGEHEVKNIKEPVRVYRVLMDSDSTKTLVELIIFLKLSVGSRFPTDSLHNVELHDIS